MLNIRRSSCLFSLFFLIIDCICCAMHSGLTDEERQLIGSTANGLLALNKTTEDLKQHTASFNLLYNKVSNYIDRMMISETRAIDVRIATVLLEYGKRHPEMGEKCLSGIYVLPQAHAQQDLDKKESVESEVEYVVGDLQHDLSSMIRFFKFVDKKLLCCRDRMSKSFQDILDSEGPLFGLQKQFAKLSGTDPAFASHGNAHVVDLYKQAQSCKCVVDTYQGAWYRCKQSLMQLYNQESDMQRFLSHDSGVHNIKDIRLSQACYKSALMQYANAIVASLLIKKEVDCQGVQERFGDPFISKKVPIVIKCAKK